MAPVVEPEPVPVPEPVPEVEPEVVEVEVAPDVVLLCPEVVEVAPEVLPEPEPLEVAVELPPLLQARRVAEDSATVRSLRFMEIPSGGSKGGRLALRVVGRGSVFTNGNSWGEGSPAEAGEEGDEAVRDAGHGEGRGFGGVAAGGGDLEI